MTGWSSCCEQRSKYSAPADDAGSAAFRFVGPTDRAEQRREARCTLGDHLRGCDNADCVVEGLMVSTQRPRLT